MGTGDGGETEDSMDITMEADNRSAAKDVFYALRRFRAASTTPYGTEHAPARQYRPPRPPGPDNTCHGCGSWDHFARTGPRLRTEAPLRRPQDVRFTTDVDIIGDAPPTPPPPAIPQQGAPDGGGTRAWYIPTAISAINAVADDGQGTAILDIGTPSDIVGDTWLREPPHLVISPMKPYYNRFVLGRDVPHTLGRLGLRLPTTTAAGYTVYLDFPDFHVLRHNTVPLLV